jgi:hypothetical protein
MSAKKPIIDQIKETIDNREQIREDLIRNLQTTKKIVEIQAKDLLERTKKSNFFKSKVVPLAESELADKALDVLNTKLKLKGTPMMSRIEKLRKDIIDTKFSEARNAQPVETTAEDSETTKKENLN